MMRATIAAVGLLLATTAEAQENGSVPVEELVLPNGFRLLVVEVPDAPRVATSLWYRVGGIGEAQGEHGSTHFLEHAIHQGTATVGTTDFAAEQSILREIYETEQEFLEARNAARNELRERRVFYDELDWPSSSEMDTLRQRLYELEDENSRYREFWAEYNWYRRYGARVTSIRFRQRREVSTWTSPWISRRRTWSFSFAWRRIGWSTPSCEDGKRSGSPCSSRSSTD